MEHIYRSNNIRTNLVFVRILLFYDTDTECTKNQIKIKVPSLIFDVNISDLCRYTSSLLKYLILDIH